MHCHVHKHYVDIRMHKEMFSSTSTSCSRCGSCFASSQDLFAHNCPIPKLQKRQLHVHFIRLYRARNEAGEEAEAGKEPEAVWTQLPYSKTSKETNPCKFHQTVQARNEAGEEVEAGKEAEAGEEDGDY